MIKWIKKWFMPKMEVQITKEDYNDGVLFGINPPEGYYFDVGQYGGTWSVYIYTDDGLYVCGGYASPAASDEIGIREAAQQALRKLSRDKEIANLSGNYPPKDTRTL